MRTEEQPEIVEEGLKEGGGRERERGDRSIESSEYRDGQAEERDTRNSAQVYEKWRNKNESSEYVNIEYVLRRSRQMYQVLKNNRSYL